MKASDMNSNDKFGRIIIFGVWGYMQVMVLLLSVAMLSEGVIGQGWYMLLLLSVCWTLLIYSVLHTVPVIILKEDGVHCRVLFKTKVYAWSSIEQAGVLWSMGRYARFNDLVLLKPGGSKRKYKDKTFRFRNMGKLIHVSPKEENIRFVCKYYGPLDFNLSDGREETCAVVEGSAFEDG